MLKGLTNNRESLIDRFASAESYNTSLSSFFSNESMHFSPSTREAIILKYPYHFDEERFLDETEVNCQNCKGKILCGQASQMLFSERSDSNRYLMLTSV